MGGPENRVCRSPSQSASDDSYSVISDSEILDLQSEQATANASFQPASLPETSAAVDCKTELHDALRLEIFHLTAEQDEALQKAKEHEAAKKAAKESIHEQLYALSKKTGHTISDIPTLINKYDENSKFAKTVVEVYYKGQVEKNHDKSREISKLKRDIAAKTESSDKELSALKDEKASMQEQIQVDALIFAVLQTDSQDMEKEIVSLREQNAELTAEVAFLQSEESSTESWAHPDLKVQRKRVKDLKEPNLKRTKRIWRTSSRRRLWRQRRSYTMLDAEVDDSRSSETVLELSRVALPVLLWALQARE